MFPVGFWVGLGDRARDENDQIAAESRRKRDTFAEDLRKVAESPDWGEESRNVAARIRHALLSPGAKFKEKDYAKLWDQVRAASARPGQPSAEVAAAASEVPALQSLRQKIAPTQGPTSAMPDGSAPQQTMDLLRPQDGPSTGNFMNIRPAPQTNTLLAPRSFSETIDDSLETNKRIVANAPPPPMVYGPKTAAERNMEAMEAFKQQQALRLDTYRQQKQIDNDMRPDKYVFGADGQVIMNPETGEIKPTGVTKPQPNSTEMEQAIADYLVATGQPDTPSTRTAARVELRRRFAEAGRDPNPGNGVSERFERTFELSEARFLSSERDRILNNALDIRRQFQKDTQQPRLSLQMARDLEVSARQATRGGDFVMLYNLVKSVDPQSVVREGEINLLKAMLSTWANMEQWARKLTGSNAALPNEARQAALDAARLLKQASIGKWQEAIESAEMDASQRQVQPGLVGLDEVDPRTFAIRKRVYPQSTLPQPTLPGQAPGVSGPPSVSGGFAAALVEALKGGKP